MYTRCPECATVFRVTAEQLRMAHGEVRCGNCQKSFNALLSLMDERPHYAEEITETPADEPALQSDEDLEFNAPEQSWQSFFIAADPMPSPPPTPLPPADEAPVEQVQTEAEAAADVVEEPLNEPLDEHTGEHEEWRGMLNELAESEDAAGAAELTDDIEDGPLYSVGSETDYGDDEPTNEHPIIELSEEIDDFAEEPVTVPEPDPEEEGSGIHWVLEDAGEEETDADLVAAAAEKDQGGAIRQFAYAAYADEVVADDPDDVADNFSDDFSNELASAEDTLPPWISEQRLDEAFPEEKAGASPRWFGAGAALLLLLLLQLVHYNRDSLATHPSFGGAVRATYDAFNMTLFPEWGLNAFEVTGSDAVAGRSAPEALDVLAEVAIKSRNPVGLPLVRVVLRDRWSNPVANRVFRPSEYSPRPIEPNAVAAPGATIPVEVSVMDPGTDALGYLVDICIPHRTQGLLCQLAENPFKR